MKWIIIGIVAVIGLVFVVKELVVSNQGEKVIMDVISSQMTDQDTKDMEQSIAGKLGWDTKEMSLVIDSSLQISLENQTEYSYTSQSKLVASVAAKSLDLVILERDLYEHYEKEGYFIGLNSCFSKEQLEMLGSAALTGTVPEVSKDEVSGILLSEFPEWETFQAGMKEPVIAVIANSRHQKEAVECLQFLTRTQEEK